MRIITIILLLASLLAAQAQPTMNERKLHHFLYAVSIDDGYAKQVKLSPADTQKLIKLARQYRKDMDKVHDDFNNAEGNGKNADDIIAKRSALHKTFYQQFDPSVADKIREYVDKRVVVEVPQQ